MARTCITVLLTAGLIGGCAAAMPGYVPDSPKRTKMLANVPKGGGFDDGGSYSLTEQEEKLDCKHLAGSITIKIIQMREAAGRAAPSAGAVALQQGMRPFKGGTTYAQDIDTDYRRDRARLESLNARLVEKSCKSFDLDAELKPGNTEVPKPTVDARKTG